jgi:transcriptional regulator with XRE-family HTH domain
MYLSPMARKRTAGVSKASIELRDRVRPDLKTAAVADDLGVSRQAIHAWIQGVSKPGPELRAKIETLLGIPADAWL